MVLAFVLFAVGFALVVKGGDSFIDAAEWISDVTGISKVVIGATLVSFATTSPEYFVSSIAVARGYYDMSIGNVSGSLAFNTAICFGILAILTPGKVHDKMFWVKGLIMVISTGLLLLMSRNGQVSVIEGMVLLALLAVMTFINIKFSKDESQTEKKQTNKKDIIKNVSKFILGAAAVVYGSSLIVDNGQVIAGFFGMPEIIMGLIFVSIGTSLPELTTSIIAVVKKQNALSLGNIFGANIILLGLVIPTGTLLSSGQLSVGQTTAAIDLPFAIAIMLIAAIPTVIGKRIYRLQGIALFTVYALFITFILI